MNSVKKAVLVAVVLMIGLFSFSNIRSSQPTVRTMDFADCPFELPPLPWE